MHGSNSSSASPPRRSPLPSVDVLVPHLNDIDGLTLTLASIDAQDWPGTKRIVLVDDGSTAEVVRELEALVEARDSSTVLIKNPTNQGRPRTRNVLLDAVESDYLAWLDTGDEWYPAKLSAQFERAEALNAAKRDEPIWMTCHYDWQWTGGRRRRLIQRTQQDQLRALLRGRTLRAYLWTLLGRSQTFRNVGWFDERLPRLQDLDFFLRFILKGGSLEIPDTDAALCVYHKSDIGRNADEVRTCNAYIYDKHRTLYNRYGPAFRREQLFHMEMHAARFAANNQDPARKRHFMWQAFKRRPRQFAHHVLSKGLRP